MVWKSAVFLSPPFRRESLPVHHQQLCFVCRCHLGPARQNNNNQLSIPMQWGLRLSHLSVRFSGFCTRLLHYSTCGLGKNKIKDSHLHFTYLTEKSQIRVWSMRQERTSFIRRFLAMWSTRPEGHSTVAWKIQYHLKKRHIRHFYHTMRPGGVISPPRPPECDGVASWVGLCESLIEIYLGSY